jgi:uncharacterized membrane protein YcaP (DUF421 family)
VDVLRDWALSGAMVANVVLSAAVIYVALLLFSRLIGPRSFAQMTAFDFAVTVAIGAIVGSAAASTTPPTLGLVAMVSLFALRGTVAALRRRGLDRLVDNRPVLLIRDGRILEANLRAAKVTRDDVLAGIRLAGVSRLEDVAALVIERNGEFSVLTTPPDDTVLSSVDAGEDAGAS